MRKKESRKEKIVHAAIQCFAEQGVAQSTMSQVAQKAGVDQPLIHYYFPSTESLYREVFMVVLESLKDASLKPFTAPLKDPAKTLAAYIEAPFRWARKEPGLFSIWMYFYYLSSFQGAFRELNSEIRQTGRERISVIIYGGIEEKLFKVPSGIAVRDVALMIQSLITGGVIVYGTERDQSAKVMENTVRTALQLLNAS